MKLVALDAVLRIAWSADLRGYMAQLAGPDSAVSWLGTFARSRQLRCGQ